MNYPRRQQYRRLGRALVVGASGLIAAGGALLAAAHGALSIALVLLLVAIALGVRARHWTRLAGRSRVGARSEEQVQRALAPLVTEGWRLRHSLPWRGRGDIDSVAIAPTGVAFTIETKTTTFDGQHIARARDGPVASGPPPALVPSRRAPGPARGPRQPVRARRCRRADCVPGPASSDVTERRGHAGTPGLPRPVTWAVAMSDELLGALARAWNAIRARHRDVPPVVLAIGSCPRRPGTRRRLGHFAAMRWLPPGSPTARLS